MPRENQQQQQRKWFHKQIWLKKLRTDEKNWQGNSDLSIVVFELNW